MATKAHRLPRTIRPTRYDLHLTATPQRDTFDGIAEIGVVLDEPTTRIELHAHDIGFDHAQFEIDGHVHKATTEFAPDTESVVFVFDDKLPVGEGVLRIGYHGKVARDMSGLYLSEDGDERCLATQCEATAARAVFPCFDEPCFKAPIRWTVTAPSDLVVLTNGVLDTVDDDGDMKTWRFHPTRPIPSYLAALAIGAFAHTEETTVDGVPFRIYALAGKEKHGVYAQRFSERLLPWYQDYFGQPYPFGKYDQVAVPSFSFGAMENVGLVVFRATLLLMDPATTSWAQKKQVAMVVAHEFAHMWFGNLVTMEWWDDLWLNEAFAEWIAHKVVDELEPGLDAWEMFQARNAGAFSMDALKGTHPIYHPVETPEEALEMFDAVTYEKGGTVLRMLEGYLGAETFREGLRSYMAAFREGNARGEDLWNHLASASDEPVAQIMQAWVTQPGHPVVSVALDGTTVRLTQRRYRSTPTAQTDPTVWPIPLVIRYADDDGVKTARHLMRDRDDEVVLDANGPVGWLYANADDAGFYRLAPSHALVQALGASFDQLTPTERFAFLRDQWGLVRDGTLTMGVLLTWLEALATPDADYHTLSAVVGRLGAIDHLLRSFDDAGALVAFRSWVAARFAPAMHGWSVDPDTSLPPTERERRKHVLRAAAAIARDTEAVDHARAIALREARDPASVGADLAGLSIAVSAMTGDRDELRRQVAVYEARRKAAAPPQQTDRYIASLGAFEADDLVADVLRLTTTGLIPNQSVGSVLAGMLGEPHAQRRAWGHLTKHWATLRDAIGESWIVRLVEAAGDLPPSMRAEIDRFFDANLDGLGAQARVRALERMDERAEFEARVKADLVSWAQDLAR